MKLDDIQSEWDVDSKIDKTDLAVESLKSPELHNKYRKMLSHERMILKGIEAEAKSLKLAKFEFYTQGHTEQTRAAGWVLPAKGRLLKQEVAAYIEADDDVIAIDFRIAKQQDKVDFLRDVIETINRRSYHIRNAIDFMKFMNGS